MKQNPLKDKKLFKFIDQNQALKAIMDHISKLGIASTPSDKTSKKGGDKKAPEPETSPKVNEIVVKKYDESFKFVYDPSVKDVRKFILCCAISNVELTQQSLKEFLQFQTKLHDGICKKRELATIATHDLGLVPTKSIRYAAKLKDDILIKPLGRGSVVTAAEYYNKLKGEADAIRKEKKRSQFTGIYKFLHLLDDQTMFAFLESDDKTTLSLPPLTNSDVTKLSTNTKKILIEITSSDNAAICNSVMSQLLYKALELNLSPSDEDICSLTLEQVRFVSVDGDLMTVYPSKIDLLELENATTKVVRP